MTVVTSSPSRACVHRACTVYVALPSASRQTTFRSGQATAAPVASGSPIPIAPPVTSNQSCGGAPRVFEKNAALAVIASSTTTESSGISAPTTAAALSGVSAPSGKDGGSCDWRAAAVPCAPSSSASASSAPTTSSAGPASVRTSHSGGLSSLGLPG